MEAFKVPSVFTRTGAKRKSELAGARLSLHQWLFIPALSTPSSSDTVM